MSAHRSTLVLVPLLVAAFATATVAATVHGKPTKAQPAHARVDSTKWSATTWEAAANEANKKMLASGRRMKVTGEVVDVSCYLQLGKRGAAHVACGSKCIAAGQPIGIVDKAENLYVLFPEEHHPRRDGQVEVRTKFGPLLAKKVSVEGTVTRVHGVNGLFVSADAQPDTLAAGGAK